MNRVRSKHPHDPIGYVRRFNRVGSFFLFFVATSVFADIALYHTLEIDLRDPETIRIYAPVHAPELMLDKATTDFSDIGQEWLDELSDEDFEILLQRSQKFVNETIRLRLGALNVNNGFPFTFEKSNDETAPGSLVGTMEFPNPGGELRIELSPKSEKRLQVAINLPQKFPETRDLAAGESTVLILPNNPNPPYNWLRVWLVLVVIPVVFFGGFWVRNVISKAPTVLD